MGYPLFARLVGGFQTLWALVAVQAIVTSALLVRVGSCAAGGGLRGSILAALGLATVVLLSGCARYVSWLMPHVMTGWLFLACLLWLLARRRLDRIVAVALLAFVLPAHNTHPPLLLASGMAVAAGALALPALGRTARRAAVGLGVLGLLAFPWTMAVNAGVGGSARAFQGGSAFLVHELVDNGVLVLTLDRYCADGERHWKLCDHRDAIAAHEDEGGGWFLYAMDSPIHTVLDGWQDPELSELTAHAFRCCWPTIARETIAGTWQQFWAIDSHAATAFTNARFLRGLLEKRMPREAERMKRSRQNLGIPVPVVLHPLSEKLLQAIWLVAAVVLAAATARAPSDRRLLLLSGTVAFLTLNAAICAAASPVFDWYQGRVAWLLPFALVIATWWTVERPTSRGARANSAPPAASGSAPGSASRSRLPESGPGR